jgi:head-tail adaptor
MRAGDLKQRVTIEQATDVQSSSGEPQRTWANVYTNIAARVEYLVGHERATGMDAVSGDESITILIRGPRTIDKATMRVDFGGSKLDIISVRPLDGKPQDLSRELQLRCVDGISQGS